MPAKQPNELMENRRARLVALLAANGAIAFLSVQHILSNQLSVEDARQTLGMTVFGLLGSYASYRALTFSESEAKRATLWEGRAVVVIALAFSFFALFAAVGELPGTNPRQEGVTEHAAPLAYP